MCKKDLIHLAILVGYSVLERWLGKTKSVRANSLLELVGDIILRRKVK